VSDAPAIHERLLDVITDAGVNLRVGLIIDSCIVAVEQLDSLDQTIYQQFRAPRTQGAKDAPTKQQLSDLAGSVLQGLRTLVGYLGRLESSSTQTDDDDFDFDFGESPQLTDDITLTDDDILGALDSLAPKAERSIKFKWAELCKELTSLSYALSSQLKDFDQRFEMDLETGRLQQALRELDDLGNSLIDGMFALMSTICEAFLDDFDRDQMLPGHRDTLGKALLVRRGLAGLRSSVNECNGRVQDTNATTEMQQTALDQVAEGLESFIEGEVFSAMRPADRMELQGFHAEIADKTVKEGGLSCEGLDKYLDSLATISQRDVLIKHDREAISEIAGLLEGAEPLVDISPHGAIDLVGQAFSKAESLYGYRDDTDGLLAEWYETSGTLKNAGDFVALGKRLLQLVR